MSPTPTTRGPHSVAVFPTTLRGTYNKLVATDQKALKREDFTQLDETACAEFQQYLELIGRRWASAILIAGIKGARRFGEFRAAIPGISDRMLAQRMRELEDAGLLDREVIPSTPVLIRYSLTPDGHEMMRALLPLVKWASDTLSEDHDDRAASA